MKPLRITAVLLALLVIPLFASQVFSATFAHLDTTYVPWDTIGKYTDDQPLLGFRIDGVSGPSEYLESVTVKSFITKAFSIDRLKLYAESNGTKGLQVPGDLKIGEVNTHDLAFDANDTLKFFPLNYALNETPDSNLFYVAVDANTDSISVNLPLYHGQLLEAIIMPGRIVLTSMSNPDSVYNRPDFAEPVPEITGFCPRYWNPPYFPNCRYRLVFDTEPPRVWYVSTTGNDTTGDGSEGNPFATIQKGIDMADDGDTVLVADGTYTGDGNRDIDFSGKSIILISENGPEFAIIDCEETPEDYHGGIYFFNGEDSTSVVDGFTITGSRFGSDPRTHALSCSSSSPTIKNCNYMDNPGGPAGGGAALLWHSSPTLINCSFIRNAAWSTGAISISGGSPTLINCTFIGNSANSAGALGCGNSTPTLLNCTFSGNFTYYSQEGVIEIYDNCFLSLTNCIIAFSSQGEAIHCQGSGSATVTCCDVYGNADGNWVGCIADQAEINGNFSADPRFCDTANGDFHIASNSPCAPENTSCEVVIGAFEVGCPALNRIWYVSTTGNDTTGDGSESNPFGTIQKGVDVALDGDTVLVEPGTYYENVLVLEKNIVLASRYITSGDTSFISSAVIDGGASGNCIDFSLSAGKIAGLTLTNGYTGGGGGIHIGYCPSASGDSLIVSSNRIIDNLACGIFVDHSGALITNNVFINNHDDYAGGGIYSYNYDSSAIVGNLFVGNSTSGYAGGAIGCQANVHPIIKNNTIYGNSAPSSAGGGIDYFVNCHPEIINNIVVHNSGGGIRGSGDHLFYNDVWGNFNGEDYIGCEPGTGDISCDPEFCDAENGNYYLLSTSCCIGAGQNGENIGAFGLCSVPDTLWILSSGPVDLIVTDPVGDSIWVDSSTIQDATYDTALYIDSVTIPHPYVGEYQIKVIREEGAPEDSTYDLGIRINGSAVDLLADDEPLPPPDGCSDYSYETLPHLKGDVNGDDQINSADIVYLINYLFKSGPAPDPLELGYVNCNDDVINSADVVYLIDYLFKGGPAPCS